MGKTQRAAELIEEIAWQQYCNGDDLEILSIRVISEAKARAQDPNAGIDPVTLMLILELVNALLPIILKWIQERQEARRRNATFAARLRNLFRGAR